MKQFNYLLLGLGLAFLCQCQMIEDSGSSLQAFWEDGKIRQIYDAQSARDTPSLIAFLSDTIPLYRERAALALASVQDTHAVDTLNASLMKEKEESVRAAIVFALGQIGSKRAIPYFKLSYNTEFSYTVRQLNLEAWGKCAWDSAISGLGNFKVKSMPERLGQVRGIFRAGLKGFFNERAREKMIQFLQDPEEEIRIVASYHFGRFASQYPEKEDSLLMSRFQMDPNPNVRANLARALAYAKNPGVPKLLRVQFDKEKDYRVRVNIIRATRSFDYEKVLVLIDEGILDCNFHVSEESARVLAYFQRANQDEAVQTDIEQVANTLFEHLRNSIHDTCQHPDVIEILVGPLLHESTKYQNYDKLLGQADVYDEVEAIRSMAYYPEQFDYLYKRYRKDTSLLIRSAVLEAFLQMQEQESFKAWTQAHPEALLNISKTWKRAVESGDVGAVYYAATALRSETWDYKAMFGEYSFIQKALDAMELPRDIEAYQELAQTLAQWQGKENPIVKKPPVRGIPWETLERLSARPIAVLETDQGTVKMELFPKNAPASVASMVQLLDSGFYEGKAFHRVVSNFVAQGGCPRGDGFGGLAYSVPSEFAPDFYKTGTVGLASAGKDTESCQFFISHSPTVHLDGRYTIIGEVVEGMDVVHALQMGDRIQKAYLEKR